jgi:hypothetical protein
VELHIANARFSERRTQPALVTPGRLHGDARRPGLRDPGRQGLRGVGDPFDLPRQTSIQAFETSTPTRTSPPLPCIAPPGQSERRPLVGTPDCIRASRAQTAVRVSDRDAGGSGMATVVQDQSTIGAPAGVPSSTKDGQLTMQSTRNTAPSS